MRLTNITDAGNGMLVPVSQRAAGHNLWSASEVQLQDLPLSKDLRFFQEAVNRFVAGGVYLVGGVPGSGKSLLLLQVALDLGRRGIDVLLILTEQGASAAKARAVAMTRDMPPAAAQAAMRHVHVVEHIYEVSGLPNFLTREVLSPAGSYHGVKLIVLDSVQGDGLPAAATKAYARVLEFCRLCQANGISTALVSHVTKKGEIAGPRTLEHGVDTTIIVRRGGPYVLLAVRKNRSGPTMLKPKPLQIDGRTMRLRVAPQAESAPGEAKTFAGTGSLVSVQARVTIPSDGRAGRLTAPGLPKKEVEQLIDCIGQIDNLDMSDMDYRIQCRLPGQSGYLSYYGLPLCMALIASYTRHPIPPDCLYLGEIDLFRKVLPLASDLLQMLQDALASGGITGPLKLFAPAAVAAQLSRQQQLSVIPCRCLEDAIHRTWSAVG